jgi:hypothetical protein
MLINNNTAERFWAKVNKTDTCWLWTASIKPEGYGQFNVGGKTKLTHRLAYELVVGEIPKGLELDHLCKIRHCVNPAHLEPVTHGENMKRAGIEMRKTPKTHCVNGHEFTVENTYTNAKGRSVCRICLNVSRKKSMAKTLDWIHQNAPQSY